MLYVDVTYFLISMIEFRITKIMITQWARKDKYIKIDKMPKMLYMQQVDNCNTV